jgi:hypothetical protein
MTDFEVLVGVPQLQPDRRTISNDHPTWVATVQGASVVTTRTRSLATTPQTDSEEGAMVVVVVDAFATGAPTTNAISIAAARSGEHHRNAPGDFISSVSHRWCEMGRRPAALYCTKIKQTDLADNESELARRPKYCGQDN